MNSFRPGNMGIAEGVALAFGMLMSRIFVSSVSTQIIELQQIIWLQIIIDSTIAALLFAMMIYVIKYTSGDILAICTQLVGKFAAWIILLAYIILFFANSALLLRLYTEYTLLTALARVDFQAAIMWFAISVGILCFLGVEPLARASYILLPVIVAALFLVFIMLYPFYIVEHLSPWQGTGIINAVQQASGAVGFSHGVLGVIILATPFRNIKTLKCTVGYSLSIVAVLKVCFIIAFIMVFGTNVGSEKAMPFYEMARLVYLSEFIQRIEALFIIIWVFLGLSAIAGSLYIGLYLIAVLFKLPDLRPIIPAGTIVISTLSMIPPNIGIVLQLDALLIQAFNTTMYAAPILLFIMVLLKKRRKKTCASG